MHGVAAVVGGVVGGGVDGGELDLAQQCWSSVELASSGPWTWTVCVWGTV